MRHVERMDEHTTDGIYTLYVHQEKWKMRKEGSLQVADYIKSDTKKAKVKDKDWRQSHQVQDGGVTSCKR